MEWHEVKHWVHKAEDCVIHISKVGPANFCLYAKDLNGYHCFDNLYYTFLEHAKENAKNWLENEWPTYRERHHEYIRERFG